VALSTAALLNAVFPLALSDSYFSSHLFLEGDIIFFFIYLFNLKNLYNGFIVMLPYIHIMCFDHVLPPPLSLFNENKRRQQQIPLASFSRFNCYGFWFLTVWFLQDYVTKMGLQSSIKATSNDL
jgi:hypothetical protein